MKKPFYKKIWFWLLVFIVIGGAGAAATNKKKKEEITSVEKGTDTKISIDKQENNNSSTTNEKSDELSMDAMLLFDEGGVKCNAIGISNDKIWGYGVDIELENTSDRNYTVQCRATIVNDYMIFDLFSCEIAAGKKAKDTIHLSSSELEAAGIENIGKIDIYFILLDPDTFHTEYELEPVTIKTSAYDQMDTKADVNGKTLYDENGIKIIGKYVDQDSFWGAGVCFYIENNTDKKLVITAEDVSVNGYMLHGYLYCDIYPGKKAVDDMSFLSSDLEENGITSVDDIELCFEFMDEDYHTEKTDPIKFSTK